MITHRTLSLLKPQIFQIPKRNLSHGVRRIKRWDPLPQKVRVILSNGATVFYAVSFITHSYRWMALPTMYTTMPLEDDVFKHRDFTKIPLYMQSATPHTLRKNGVDPDFKTTIIDRLRIQRKTDMERVKRRKEEKIYRREQALLDEQARKEEESAANALAAAERAREELQKRKKREREEEAAVRKGGAEALKALTQKQTTDGKDKEKAATGKKK